MTPWLKHWLICLACLLLGLQWLASFGRAKTLGGKVLTGVAAPLLLLSGMLLLMALVYTAFT